MKKFLVMDTINGIIAQDWIDDGMTDKDVVSAESFVLSLRDLPANEKIATLDNQKIRVMIEKEGYSINR